MAFFGNTLLKMRATILLVLLALMAQLWSENQAVPVTVENSQAQAMNLASFGFTDWLEQIGAKVSGELKQLKDKAKKILVDIEVVGKDAWDKIKEALGDIEVAKGKFVETILPEILKVLKTASRNSEVAAEAVIGRLVNLLTELGVSSLEQALSYILSHRDQIEDKICEIITAHLIKAIGKATGLETYAALSFDDDRLKLVLIKLLDRCRMGEVVLDSVAVLALEPFHLQRVARILRDMKIENPADSDLIDGLLLRVDAVDGVVRSFGHGGNIFEEILKKIIARVEEDPVKVAEALLRVFLPLGKEATSVVLHHLKELVADWPSKSLQIVIDILEKAIVDGGKIAEEEPSPFTAPDMHKGDLDVFAAVAEEALDSLLLRGVDLKSVENHFMMEVFPALIAITRNLANKTSEVAAKVAEVLVSLLRRLGSRAIKAAIQFVDDHEEEIGDRLHDFLLQRLQDALAEISYVREFGLNNLVNSLNRAQQ